MIDPKSLSLSVTVDFDYDAEVYDDDPSDAYEIAHLESVALSSEIEAAISEVLVNARFFKVTVRPT